MMLVMNRIKKIIKLVIVLIQVLITIMLNKVAITFMIMIMTMLKMMMMTMVMMKSIRVMMSSDICCELIMAVNIRFVFCHFHQIVSHKSTSVAKPKTFSSSLCHKWAKCGSIPILSN